ncbi:hypothetical protein [Candidatus Ruthturnera calyptogenae]|uniref:hypothetical protein n=1 Tax=Candidatus Ruthturnera calyptogenae TaxID=386487 RepID=UPI00031E125D|nr:hypothetical protein [Candidatus Ruthturnera calyptogenae]
MQEVTDKLIYYKFYVLVMSGYLDQRKCDQALIIFSNKSMPILMATDVAVRDLDIDSLD